MARYELSVTVSGIDEDQAVEMLNDLSDWARAQWTGFGPVASATLVDADEDD